MAALNGPGNGVVVEDVGFEDSNRGRGGGRQRKEVRSSGVGEDGAVNGGVVVGM